MPSLIRYFQRPQNWPILAIPLLLALWARFGATPLGTASFESALLYRGPYLEALPPGEEGEPVAQRVALIIVDGLRVDASQQMPALNDLREQGAERILTAGQISLSLPGWTALTTGAWQEQSGFNSNYPERPVEIDSIFQAARRASYSTALVGTPGWQQLYEGQVDDLRTLPDPPSYTDLADILDLDRQLADIALDVLEAPPDLALFYLPGVDTVGHGFGGASEEYLQAALNADAQIARILAAVDLSVTAVFVTTDHGHTDTGGHGGWEPEVLRVPLVSVGQGIRPGDYPDARQADVAPTIAVMLGASFPAHNMGDPLFDQIDASDDLIAARAVDHARQIAGRYNAMLATIGSAPASPEHGVELAEGALDVGDMSGAQDFASLTVDHARYEWSEARSARLMRERLLHLPIAVLILLPFALYVLWWRRSGWDWRAPVTAAALYFALWYVTFFAIRRLTYSVSWFNKDEDIELFLTARVMETMALLALCMIVVGLWRYRAGWGEVARDAVHTLFLIALALLVQILIFYVWWNVTFAWYLPEDAALAFKYYVDLFTTTAFWPMVYLPVALLLPLIALGAAGVARLLTRRRGRPAPQDVASPA